MSNFFTVYGLRVLKFLEDLSMKKLKCLLASMKLHTKSENHYSNPFQRPYTCDFDPNNTYSTVTRLDVIFRYPDRVPLTHFVHRAKKVFAMWAWIFCWVLCATGIFRRCNGIVIEHRVGANLRPSDYEPGVLPMRHCSLVCKVQGHSFSSFAGIFRQFL